MPAPAGDAVTDVDAKPGDNPGETTVTVTTYTDATRTKIKSVEIRSGPGDEDGAWDRYTWRVVEFHDGDHIVRVIETGVTWVGDEPKVGLRTTRFVVVERYAYPNESVRTREVFRITEDREGMRYCIVTEIWHNGQPRRGLCFEPPYGIPVPHYWPSS